MRTEILSTLLYNRSVFQHLRFENAEDELMCCYRTSRLYLLMKCHQRQIGNARYCDEYLYCSKKKHHTPASQKLTYRARGASIIMVLTTLSSLKLQTSAEGNRHRQIEKTKWRAQEHHQSCNIICTEIWKSTNTWKPKQGRSKGQRPICPSI